MIVKRNAVSYYDENVPDEMITFLSPQSGEYDDSFIFILEDAYGNIDKGILTFRQVKETFGEDVFNKILDGFDF